MRLLPSIYPKRMAAATLIKHAKFMQINRYQNQNKFTAWMAAVILFMMVLAASGYTGGGGEKIVASGDDFVMTQKVVDAYGTFFVSQKLHWSQDEVIKTALKYELLSREYRKKQESQSTAEISLGNSDKVEAKILDGKKYIPTVLDNWAVSNAVIESYYRSNPEKYAAANTPDGKITLMPLDDRLKSEIRFKIIEGKKEVIVKEFVDSLISKYHIEIDK